MSSEGLAPEQVRTLLRDLNPARVANRRGGGGASLSYLESFDVKATLIRVFGYGGFSAEVTDTRILRDETNTKGQYEVTALCTVRLTIHATGAVYTESAVAGQVGSQHGEVADFAVKTAESDALKRAAVYLGSQYGLSLYSNGSTRDVVRVIVEPIQAGYLTQATPKEVPDGATQDASV